MFYIFPRFQFVYIPNIIFSNNLETNMLSILNKTFKSKRKTKFM